MTFGMTRDSLVWWLAIAASLLTYLAASGSPAGWNYDDWIKAASFAVATISGKLATSPLPHSEEGDAKLPPSGD